MANESSLISEHGADVISIFEVIVSFLLIIIGFALRKAIKILVERVDNLEKAINGIPGDPDGGLIYKVAQLENGKRKKRK